MPPCDRRRSAVEEARDKNREPLYDFVRCISPRCVWSWWRELGARITGPGNTAKRTVGEALTEGRPQYPQAQCWLCELGIPNCQDSPTVGSDPSGGDHWEHDRPLRIGAIVEAAPSRDWCRGRRRR